ncbi:MAG TPA: hypothetical protein VGG90_07980 [Candidatus Dormibacteraeota bacterium]
MRLRPAAVVVVAALWAIALFVLSPASHRVAHADCTPASSSPCPTPPPSPTPTPSPSPSPIPTNAFLSLDVSAGPPDTQITVNGGAFLPNEQMTLYWDTNNKVAGGANADSSGNFTTHVKPFAGDAPGVHRLYASVPPNPFADFSLQAASPTPSPSPSPSPDTSPSPSSSPSPTDVASPTPVAATLSGIDLITRPPFVFLPIIGILAILISIGYWVMSMVRRPPPTALPTAAVMHRATRPDYGAGFGTPPPAPAPDAPSPSAWTDVMPPPPAPTGRPPAEPDAQVSAPAAETWTEPEASPQPQPPSASEPDSAAAVSSDEPWSDPNAQPPQAWNEPGRPDAAGAPDDPPDLPQPGED